MTMDHSMLAPMIPDHAKTQEDGSPAPEPTAEERAARQREMALETEDLWEERGGPSRPLGAE